MFVGRSDPLFCVRAPPFWIFTARRRPTQVCRAWQVATGYQVIEANTAQLLPLNIGSLNDPRHFWTRRAISIGVQILDAGRGADVKRLAILGYAKRAVWIMICRC